MENIVVKDLKKDHIDRLIPGFIRAFGQEPWLDDWTSAAAKKRMSFYLDSPNFYGKYICKDDYPAGAILGNIMVQADGYVFHLEEFFIDPKFQGQGLARILYGQMLDDMKDLGVIGVIFTTEYNSQAYGFYKAMGAFDMEGSRVLGHAIE